MKKKRFPDCFLVGYVYCGNVKRSYFKTYAHSVYEVCVQFRENPNYANCELVCIEQIIDTEV